MFRNYLTGTIADIAPYWTYIRNIMDLTLSKIEHRGETRILLSFKYSADIVANISTITGAAYSKTYGKWHIPYTRQAFDHLLSMYPEVEYPNKQPIEDTLGANALDKTNVSEGCNGENSEPPSDVSIYSAGLRISEALELKLNDIDSDRMQIRIADAKGNRDRYTILSDKTLETLRTYQMVYMVRNIWILFFQTRPNFII